MVKFSKFSDDDFNQLLPKDTPAPSADNSADKISNETIVDIEDKEEGGATREVSESASKKKKVKQTSVRLTFSQPQFKVLSMLAIDQSERTGSRVSVTSLLQNSANKLIKKGS